MAPHSYWLGSHSQNQDYFHAQKFQLPFLIIFSIPFTADIYNVYTHFTASHLFLNFFCFYQHTLILVSKSFISCTRGQDIKILKKNRKVNLKKKPTASL